MMASGDRIFSAAASVFGGVIFALTVPLEHAQTLFTVSESECTLPQTFS
jgi:hypothetical protein